MNAAQTQNGHVPTSMWESVLLRDGLQRLVEGLVERYLRNLSFSFAHRGAAVTVLLSPLGTTIRVEYKKPCRSPDPEPNTVQSTVTATP